MQQKWVLFTSESAQDWLPLRSETWGRTIQWAFLSILVLDSGGWVGNPRDQWVGKHSHAQIPWESSRNLSDPPNLQTRMFPSWVAEMEEGGLPGNTLRYRIIQLKIPSLEIRNDVFVCSFLLLLLFKGVKREFNFGHIELETPKRQPGQNWLVETVGDRNGWMYAFGNDQCVEGIWRHGTGWDHGEETNSAPSDLGVGTCPLAVELSRIPDIPWVLTSCFPWVIWEIAPVSQRSLCFRLL